MEFACVLIGQLGQMGLPNGMALKAIAEDSGMRDGVSRPEFRERKDGSGN